MIWCLSFIVFSSASLFGATDDYKYYLSAVAIFRDDADYLKEWIEYHRLVGIEHFYLYNNLSDDDYLNVLKPYMDSGLVDLKQWPHEHGKPLHWTKIQAKAYRDAIENCSHETKWLAIFDTDEFIVPVQHDNLADLIASEEKKKKNKKIARYEMNWIIFGTSGVDRIGSDQLMIELLLQNAGKVNMWKKSIVRPQYVGHYINPHKTSLTNKLKHRSLPVSVAQVNHYVVRDQHFLHNVKIPRVGKYVKDTDYLLHIDDDCCHINDYSEKILRFIPALKERMGL